MNKKILFPSDELEQFIEFGGGKAVGLKRLMDSQVNVPPFFVLTNDFFSSCFDLENSVFVISEEDDLILKEKEINEFIAKSNFKEEQVLLIKQSLQTMKMDQSFLAIRSSGHDEDSKTHSFAGQFLSFLFQKGEKNIEKCLKECFQSAFSERVLNYRRMNGLSSKSIKMSVVIQQMINSDSAGVGFSHNPIDLSDRSNIIIESVFGQGEGLVGGLYDADQFLINKLTFSISKKQCGPKDKKLAMDSGGGLVEVDIEKDLRSQFSLEDYLVIELAKITQKLCTHFKMPIDIEWALENGKLYILQMRPITVLPNENIFNELLMGDIPILWDNSNIVESFSGVTTPLTFSYAKKGYDTVYRICCDLAGVPQDVLDNHQHAFAHMLGQINGRVYYNLLNWYRVLFLMPGSSTSKGFMETMLGVKDNIDVNKKKHFDIESTAPRYSFATKLKMNSKLLYQFIIVDKTVKKFMDLHQSTYDELDQMKLEEMSLQSIYFLYKNIEKKILLEWKAPIINDFLVMIFFGTLRKLTSKWILNTEGQSEIQNDLLCGEGDIISTRPTKDLMIMAEWFDRIYANDAKYFTTLSVEAVMEIIWENKQFPELYSRFQRYINDFGFRCSNEQKLEEKDLHEDPTMAVSSFLGYLKNKKYSVPEMEANEVLIRKNAETIVDSHLFGLKKSLFKWVLKHARKAVRNRENLRFARTRSYGTSRRIFRVIGDKFFQLDIIDHPRDIFFLTVEEIFDYIHGVSVTNNLRALALIRKTEYEENLKKSDPPERFITVGAATATFRYPQLLSSLDLLKDKFVQLDPNVFQGISCSPGIVNGVVLVAKNIQDAKMIDGEILLAYRTDPGWVPLYPNCKGLAIERGSLLSHSAVVAREMGLPTIVGLNGSPVSKIKSGMTVELNATKGLLILKPALGENL